jgi:hypothetical protein
MGLLVDALLLQIVVIYKLGRVAGRLIRWSRWAVA